MGMLLHKPPMSKWAFHLTPDGISALCLWHGGWITGCHSTESLQTPAADCSQALQSFSLMSAAQPVTGVLRLNSELRLESECGPGPAWLLYLLTVQSPSPGQYGSWTLCTGHHSRQTQQLRENRAARAELSEHICQVVCSVPVHRHTDNSLEWILLWIT